MCYIPISMISSGLLTPMMTMMKMMKTITKLYKFTVGVWAICRRKAETQDLAKVWGKAEKMRDTRKLEIWRHADKKTQEDVILGQKNCCGS